MVDDHLNLLLNLKVAKDRKGMAPNKPLLVLAILDLIEAGLTTPAILLGFVRLLPNLPNKA